MCITRFHRNVEAFQSCEQSGATHFHLAPTALQGLPKLLKVLLNAFADQ
jgi:hypothetical protein